MNRKQLRAVALAVVLVVSTPALVGVAAADERFGGTVDSPPSGGLVNIEHSDA